MVQRIFWGAVRRSRDNGHEFMVSDEMSANRDIARQKADEAAKQIAGWHAANPVVRMAQFEVKEIA